MPDRHVVRGRVLVLAVVVNAVCQDDVARMQAVQARGVVVAVEAARGVVGPALVHLGAHQHVAVNVPVYHFKQSLLAREALLRGAQGKGRVSVAVVVVQHEAEQRAVGLGVGLQGVPCLLQGVGGQVVVGIDHGDKSPFGMRQSFVARHGLSLVGGEAQHTDARVAGGVVGQYAWRVGGRGIVDADNLYVAECLPAQRVEAHGQEACPVVDSDKDGDFNHRT